MINIPNVHQEADEQFAKSAWNNGAPTFPRKYNPGLHTQPNTVEWLLYHGMEIWNPGFRSYRGSRCRREVEPVALGLALRTPLPRITSVRLLLEVLCSFSKSAPNNCPSLVFRSFSFVSRHLRFSSVTCMN